MGIAPQAQVSTRGWRATASRRPALGRRTARDQPSGPGRPVAIGPWPLVAGIPATRGRHPQVGGPRPAGD
jgi:hypothetical protein